MVVVMEMVVAEGGHGGHGSDGGGGGGGCGGDGAGAGGAGAGRFLSCVTQGTLQLNGNVFVFVDPEVYNALV